jgi:HAL2 family 3'(2'),5'-bisphosphate nucleotidase
MNDILNIAVNSVREASKICRTIQAQLVSEDTLTKKDRSPVTIADFASQAIICRMLKSEFPNVPIVGEEDANSLRQNENKAMLEKINSFLPDWDEDEILKNIDHGNGAATDYFWTLDPIDGTKGFLRGDQYAVALALIKNGKLEGGVLGCPNLPFEQNSSDGTILYSFKNEGAFVTGIDQDKIVEAHVSKNSTSVLTRFLESVESGHSNHGLQGQIMESLGDKAKAVRYDSQVKYAVLARGGAEIYLRLPNPSKPDYREKIWDHAAGAAIVNEAGGRVTDMNGNELDFSLGKQLLNNRGVIVSNGLVHEDILKLIKQLNN